MWPRAPQFDRDWRTLRRTSTIFTGCSWRVHAPTRNRTSAAAGGGFHRSKGDRVYGGGELRPHGAARMGGLVITVAAMQLDAAIPNFPFKSIFKSGFFDQIVKEPIRWQGGDLYAGREAGV